MEKRATKKKWRRVNANPSDDNESQGSFVRLDDFSEGYSCGNYESVMLKERLGCLQSLKILNQNAAQIKTRELRVSALTRLHIAVG